MSIMKYLTAFISLFLLLLCVLGDDPNDYNYPDDDSEYDSDYEYDYVYEGDDDCLDDDGDGYCDPDEEGNIQYYYDSEPEPDQVPTFGDDETSVRVGLGNTARITCTVHNLGSRVISWKKGESFLFLGPNSLVEDSRYSVTTSEESSTLAITLIRNEDAGEFTCQVATQNTMEQTFIIEIKAPPSVKIIDKPDSGQYILEEGADLKLRCQGNGDPMPTLSWKKMSAQLPPGLSPPHSDALTLSSVSDSDSGTYQCVADNGFGQPALDSVNIRVKHKPKIYVQEEFERNKETAAIELLKLICTVQAFPTAKTKWTRNDKAMPTSRVNQKHEDGKHIVEILNPTQADVGVYTCEANNEMGKVFAVLNIEDNENLPDEVDDVIMNDDAGVLKRIEYEIEKELESVSTATSPTVNLVILALIGMLLKL